MRQHPITSLFFKSMNGIIGCGARYFSYSPKPMIPRAPRTRSTIEWAKRSDWMACQARWGSSLPSDHSEVGPLASVMVIKNIPKPATQRKIPGASSCQNVSIARVLNDLRCALAFRSSARWIRDGRVPRQRTRMIGVARTGVKMVTAIWSALTHTLTVRRRVLTDSITPSPSVETRSFTKQTANNISADPNIDRSRDVGEDRPEVSTPQTGDIRDDNVLQEEEACDTEDVYRVTDSVHVNVG